MKTDTQQAKHTAGSWRIGVRQPNSDKFIYGRNGAEVANCDRLTNFPEVNLANARLIAAAPELLAFAVWARDQMVGDSGTGESHWEQFPEFNAGMRAIAKAEGRA